MAFQDFGIAPPSDAPASTARPSGTTAVTATPARRRIAAPKRRIDTSRLMAALFVGLVIAAIGIRAGHATESLAIGILAADIAFLLVAAGWSAVAGGKTR
ncbi:hypothetical protein [Sphingomonas montanisoli]|uniref:Uncharacterized protein n=1 Tax=Sphingomonas montanisoli TaxID=2606412 RepID=A0A5D9C7J2_9SPHN|nr:hypothetical protein [Sphingomonas montanisoli]TZG27659.1 hypothetical protein FYJ91_08770 [Sphingomonas montanisoli]